MEKVWFSWHIISQDSYIYIQNHTSLEEEEEEKEYCVQYKLLLVKVWTWLSHLMWL